MVNMKGMAGTKPLVKRWLSVVFSLIIFFAIVIVILKRVSIKDGLDSRIPSHQTLHYCQTVKFGLPGECIPRATISSSIYVGSKFLPRPISAQMFQTVWGVTHPRSFLNSLFRLKSNTVTIYSIKNLRSDILLWNFSRAIIKTSVLYSIRSGTIVFKT